MNFGTPALFNVNSSTFARLLGTGIQVVGTLERSDKYGQPTSSYAIDGETVGSYTAPFTPELHTGWNTTFFAKHDLSPGTHEIVVTNVNGTSPNVFWLDYFLVNDGGGINVVSAGVPSGGASTATTTATATVTVNATGTSTPSRRRGP